MKYMFIGAHPDDPDVLFGATAIKLVRKGHSVKFVAACNGNAGHYSMSRDALAKRRFAESRAAAKVIGLADYEVFDTPDCNIQPDLASREKIIRTIRTFAPDVVISHWLHDYHADHRATAQLVQDAAYLLTVPLYCDDTPIPETYPVLAYCYHGFTDPRPFRPDAAVEFDSLYDEKCRILDCHASQFYEWLPWSEGFKDFRVDNLSWEEKKKHLGIWLARFKDAANLSRQTLVETYGAPARDIAYAEAFEQTQYGRQVSLQNFRRLFNGDELLPEESFQTRA